MKAEQRDAKISEIATNVEWLMKNQGEITTHLAIINGQIGKNTTARKIGTWIGSLLVVSLIGLLITLLTGTVVV